MTLTWTIMVTPAATQLCHNLAMDYTSKLQNMISLTFIENCTSTAVKKTWRAWNKSRKKADKEARLDYFIVDSNLASYVELVGAFAPFTSDFDHRPVMMKI